MTRAVLALLLLGALSADAEGGWLTARGRLQPEPRLEAWAGSRSAGLGVVLPDASAARAGVSAELLYAFLDRTVELRFARVWQLSKNRLATASATLGGSAHVIFEGFALGVGPHAGLNLALGGERFTVDLGLQTGVEVFTNSVSRLPQRLLVGVDLRWGNWGVGLHLRGGVDVLPGRGFVGRGEATISFAWFGLSGRPLKAP